MAGPARKVLAWRFVGRQLSQGVDHHEIGEEIARAGLISGRYVAMSLLSAAIATLGLMLSSPAVVIGAMLLSPLMDPIILLGFAFWRVDWGATRRALVSLAIGLGLAVLVAILLTLILPLKTPTAEILARTRPNLVDLLIAVFSGVAGAYAVIHRRGETVIGVAIATALMPPIATVGFGIGTSNWPVATGALLLFATNLIAIALSAAAMAALYGFRQEEPWSRQGWLRHGAVIVVLGALCIPLTVSLGAIARESQATTTTQSQVKSLFGPSARLTSLKVHGSHGALVVDALVATPKFVPDASARLAGQLRRATGHATTVNLDQVVLADPSAARDPAREDADATAAPARRLRQLMPFPAAAIAYDPETATGVVMLDERSGLDLAAARLLEEGLRARSGLERIQVIPPVQPLDPVEVTSESGELAFGPEMETALWALAHWRVSRVAISFCHIAKRHDRDALLEVLASKAPSLQVRTDSTPSRCEPSQRTAAVVLQAG